MFVFVYCWYESEAFQDCHYDNYLDTIHAIGTIKESWILRKLWRGKCHHERNFIGKGEMNNRESLMGWINSLTRTKVRFIVIEAIIHDPGLRLKV